MFVQIVLLTLVFLATGYIEVVGVWWWVDGDAADILLAVGLVMLCVLPFFLVTGFLLVCLIKGAFGL